jgi:undecaprenyl-diphosphatase
MNYFEAIILGIVEGLTEFLPVSSTGHLTLAEKALGLPIDDPAVTAYTALIQIGAIAAVLLYFWGDIVRMASAWFRGLTNSAARQDHQYLLGWAVIAGSLPIGVVGFLARGFITGPLRSLWVVAIALVVWSAVMVFAERTAQQKRSLDNLTVKDALIVGGWQCIALIPGVSRSGATISAGLILGLDRVTATKLSFFLSIPALTAAGLFESRNAFSPEITVGPAVVGIVVSFVVAYASVAWLLRFVASDSIVKFVPYRVALGLVVITLLSFGVITHR